MADEEEDWTLAGSLTAELSLEKSENENKTENEKIDEKPISSTLSRRQKKQLKRKLQEMTAGDSDKSAKSQKFTKLESEQTVEAKNADNDDNNNENSNQLTRKQKKNKRSRERQKLKTRDSSSQKNDGSLSKIVSVKESESSDTILPNSKQRRKEKRKMFKQAQKLEKVANTNTTDQEQDQTTVTENLNDSVTADVLSKNANSTKLDGARFRILNQKLYTISSEEAKNMFDKDTNLSEIYHKGYTEQVKKWPVNPVYEMLDFILSKSKSTSHNTSPNNKLSVVDLGCGDAKLAKGVKSSKQSKVINISSFDLYAINEYVTVADIRKTPLPKNSVDVAVFCLSLMGVNLHEFLIEANRILKPDSGILKIAEVRSRFGEKEKLGLNRFIKGLSSLGFYFNKKCECNKISLDYKNNPNSHFLILEFKKVRNFNEKSKITDAVKNQLKLEPCVYKKR